MCCDNSQQVQDPYIYIYIYTHRHAQNRVPSFLLSYFSGLSPWRKCFERCLENLTKLATTCGKLCLIRSKKLNFLSQSLNLTKN